MRRKKRVRGEGKEAFTREAIVSRLLVFSAVSDIVNKLQQSLRKLHGISCRRDTTFLRHKGSHAVSLKICCFRLAGNIEKGTAESANNAKICCCFNRMQRELRLQ